MKPRVTEIICFPFSPTVLIDDHSLFHADTLLLSRVHYSKTLTPGKRGCLMGKYHSLHALHKVKAGKRETTFIIKTLLSYMWTELIHFNQWSVCFKGFYSACSRTIIRLPFFSFFSPPIQWSKTWHQIVLNLRNWKVYKHLRKNCHSSFILFMWKNRDHDRGKEENEKLKLRRKMRDWSSKRANKSNSWAMLQRQPDLCASRRTHWAKNDKKISFLLLLSQ